MSDDLIFGEAPKRFALSLADDGRILSATYEQYASAGAVLRDKLPTGETEREKNIHNWLDVNGEYVYDPLPVPDAEEPQPTNDERIAELEEALDMLLSGVTE